MGVLQRPKREKDDSLMTPHTTVLLSYAHERYLGRPSCPKCGVLIPAPESSRYVKGGAILHRWSCNGCVYEFETLIDLPAT
jgi:hypothetical protein